MTAASTALVRQKGAASLEDAELAAEGVELDSFLLDVSSRHKLKVNLADSITEGYIERTMEGASVISVTINDGTREILRSGMFGTKDNKKMPVIDVRVDGVWFRLTEFDKNGHEITLVFEDRIIAFLRLHKHPISASRGSCTRAEFIGRMVHSVKATKIRYFSPELHKKQPIEGIKEKKKTARERKAELSGGLLATIDLTIKHAAANKSQLEVCEQVLDAGVGMGANTKVLVSSIMCIIQESDAHNDKGHEGVDVGPFNQNGHMGWPASGDVGTDAKAYFKAAIASDKGNPGQHISDLVQSVQHSGAGAGKYAPWRQESEKIVEEYGSGTGHSARGRDYIKAFEFHVGPPDGPKGEDYWEGSGRLASEVNWRRFVVGNTLNFVQDKDLMARKPIASFSEDDEGIHEINGSLAANSPTNEATVACRASRWWAPPGSVVIVKNHGPFTGKWLVWKIRRDLKTPNTTVTLRQPEAAKPEKAPEVGHAESSEPGGLVSGQIIAGQTPRDRIVAAAKWGLAHRSSFTYMQYRPMAKSLFEKFAFTHTDCSSFATLCYKAAGLKDPNGFGYNGSGNTDSLKAQGNKSNTPEPGDLVFYHNPEHVAVYIGEGKVIELGGTPGPNEEAINYRPVAEVRNYSLETDSKLPPVAGRHSEKPTSVPAEKFPEGLGEFFR